MRGISRTRSLLVTLLVGLICWSCSAPIAKPQYKKDGKQYGVVRGTFRHRWWNFYERGLSFAEGEFYPEAIADFQEALDQRDEDQRMARTYGLHFVDYFPHRELGIVLFEAGDLMGAQTELELSLKQYPTAKARYYLDRVRRAIIRRQGLEVMPPVIRLDVNRSDIWTRDDPFILSGIIEDNNYVAGIAIQGKPVYLEASAKRIAFREKLNLSQGHHFVRIQAENLAGKTAEKSIRIHVDWIGPLITLEEISPGPAGSEPGFLLRGSIYDEAGVDYLGINGQPAAIQKNTEVFFSEIVVPDQHYVEIVGRDRLGNETVARIDLNSEILTGKSPILLASAGRPPYDIELTSLFRPKDTHPPDIRLADLTDEQTVYLDRIVIDGHITDQGQIVKLTINDRPILRRPGRLIYFNYPVDLKPGKNVLTIVATDKAGNQREKTIIINREIPLALKLDRRLSISVMPFEQQGDISPTGTSYQDNLIVALVKRDRFRIIERGQLDVILQEQKLSRTKLVDRRTALKLGRLVAAQSIIIGNIVDSRNGIEIIARFIDTETSEILVGVDVFSEAKDLTALKIMADAMALKFHRKFPLVGGIIVDKKGRFIFTDMGAEKIGIQKRLLVYREKPIRHPQTGKILGSDSQIIGRAMIKQVTPEMTKAELVEPGQDDVDRRDKVITE